MEKEKIKYTRVWNINSCCLVVADTIEEAIEVYKTNYNDDNIDSIEKVMNATYGGDNIALIYKETK